MDHTSKISASVCRVSHFTAAALANDAISGSTPANIGTPANVAASVVAEAVDLGAWWRDLHVTAAVEVLDREGERLERFAPELVDPLLAAAVEDQAAERQRLLQVLAAQAHQRIVGPDLDAQRLHLDGLGDESAARLNSAPASIAPFTRFFRGIGLGVEGGARLVQPDAGDVDAVLDVVEQPAGQRLDEPLLGAAAYQPGRRKP